METVTNVVSKMVKNPQKYGARLSLGDVDFKKASEEDINFLLEFIKNSKHLKKVSFYGMKLQALPSEIFTKVASAIQYNKNIAGLNFSRSNIDKLDAPILDQVVKLANCQHIKAMYLSYNKFGYCQEHTSQFILDISQASLQTLVMRTGALEGFNEELLQQIADNLSQNKSLINLNLENAFSCACDEQNNPSIILGKLCSSKNIKNLDISRIIDVFDSNENIWKAVFTALTVNTSLEYLNISDKGLLNLEPISKSEWTQSFINMFARCLEHSSSLNTIQFVAGDISNYKQEVSKLLTIAKKKNIKTLGLAKVTQDLLMQKYHQHKSKKSLETTLGYATNSFGNKAVKDVSHLEKSPQTKPIILKN